MNAKKKMEVYMLKSLVTNVMNTYNKSYDEALSTVILSDTYEKVTKHRLLTNESPLYVFEMLQNEIARN